MRKVVIAAVVTMACTSGAMAQSALSVAGSLTPTNVQAIRGTGIDIDAALAGGAMSQLESVALAPMAVAPKAAETDRHLARIGSARDFYPMADSGFHLTMGFRKRAQIGKMPRMSAVNAELRAMLYSPPMTQALSATDGIKRKLPMALVGWTQSLGRETALRLDAGALAIRQSRHAFSAIADASRAAARMGALAQVSFVHRF